MADPGTMAIACGQVTYAYHIAADLVRCVIAFDRATGMSALSGFVDEANPHMLRNRPLVFQVRTKTVVWRWPIEQFKVTVDGQVTARLGPMLERE